MPHRKFTASSDVILAASRVRDWIVEEGVHVADLGGFLDQLCERIRTGGVAIERATLGFEVLHAERIRMSREWQLGRAQTERTLPLGMEARYDSSPFALAYRTNDWVVLDLGSTGDEQFPVVRDLKSMGFTGYVAIPVPFTDGSENSVSFATRQARGFGEADLAFLARVVPVLAVALEIRRTRMQMDDLLRTYVGEEPKRLVLSGNVHRSDVIRISAAIMFSDIRGFTSLSTRLNDEESVALLNAYFDCFVPEIEARGGEVLKYVGDGILAIFRDQEAATAKAAAATLAAAQAGLSRAAQLSAEKRLGRALKVGVSLHHGTVAYGNIGSGSRLDFTVVGRDVNLTSRIQKANKRLDEPLLMSEPFARHIAPMPVEIGSFKLSGIAEPQKLYIPR
ncbi:MAG: adenylate/guanylate cyclase domain-containing protein [Hyphomicrobiaceae bacterium]